MKYKFIILVLILLLSNNAYSKENPGKASAQFLRISPSPRAVSMGNAFVSVIGEADSLYYNPSSISFMKNINLSFSYIKWLQAMNYMGLFGVLPLGKAGSVGIGATGLYTGDILQTSIDDQGIVSSTGNKVVAGDYCFIASYAYRIIESMSAGINLKPIYQNLENENSFCFASDLGVLFFSEKNKIRAGLSVQNIGSRPKFVKESFGLPLNLRLGASYDVLINQQNALLFILEGQKASYENFSGGIGCEYVFNNMIFVRTGYEYQSRSDSLGIKAGCGFKMQGIGVNYGFDLFGNLGSTHFFQVNYALGKMKPKALLKKLAEEAAGPKPIDAADNYVLSNDYNKALTEYNNVINADPNNVRASYNMACIYSLLNNIDKAIIWLEYTLKLDHSPAMLNRIKNDMDLDNLRYTEEYNNAIERYSNTGNDTGSNTGSNTGNLNNQ